MNNSEFNAIVRSNKRLLIIDFSAEWCGPCKSMEPALKRVAEKYTEKVDLLEIDADTSPEVLQNLGIFSIPTLLVYTQEGMVLRKTGAQSEQALAKLFESAYSGYIDESRSIGPTA